MAYRFKRVLFFSFSSLLFLTALWSCEKFEGDQTVPAYISIDSISLTTDYTTQGSESHSITDAWVLVDGNYLGTFQLPARFPVLRSSKTKITILPGIKKDGISATRQTYPFYTSVDRTVTLTPDSTTKLGTLNTTYKSDTRFLYKEDFEQTALLLDTTKVSDVAIGKTDIGSPETFEGAHSAIIIMDSAGQYFRCMSHDPIDIPSTAGAPVYLELNFKTNNPFNVGMELYAGTYVFEPDIVTLVSTNGKWKKVYIDLSTLLNASGTITKFRLSMNAFKSPEVAQARILLDNIKIVTNSQKK